MMTVRAMMEFLSRCDGDDYVVPCSWVDSETREIKLCVRVVAHEGSGIVDDIQWLLQQED